MIQALKEQYKKIWDNTPETFPVMREAYGTVLAIQRIENG
jgi:hypothetical protein